MKVGDFVKVDFVRSNHLDPEKGIGWFAHDVIVQVTKIYDPTFCFQFNGQLCFALQENAKKVKNNTPDLFEAQKITYTKERYDFLQRLKEFENEID